MEIEKTGDEIATKSLNMTFARAVPKKARIKTYPIEIDTFSPVNTSCKGKFEKINIIVAGNKIAIKFPKAMASADIPSNLYFIRFTFIA